MKFVPAIIGIAVAGAAGYFLEPSLRPSLVKVKGSGVENPVKEGSAAGEEPESAPVPEPPEVEVPEWVATLAPEQLPEKVTLLRAVSLEVADSPQPIELPAGAKVSPVRVDGGMLVFSFASGVEGEIPIGRTDLVAMLGDKAPEPVEEEVVAVVEETEMTTPDPVPEPVPEESAALGPEDIIKAMQASVAEGGVKEFTADQVTEWKAGEDLDRDGETYQTGIASYKAETIFGVKEIQAQALVKGGKVAKWIWPKSGMEIK